MRPNKLIIYGINSYTTEQTIDFNRLAESNLFGVFGETGSGKSTILDAMLLALFGSSERGKLESIINVNLVDAYVKFYFDDIVEGKVVRYLVERNFKKRPSGITSTAILTNLTTKLVLADSTDKVNAETEKIVGMSKSEFLKCVALPQNEFDTFIMDTPADRKKSISKIFNLQNFGDKLNTKVRFRESAIAGQEQVLIKQLEMFGDLNEEKQAELEKTYKSEEQEIKNLEQEVIRLKAVVEGLEEAYDKTKKYNNAYSDMQELLKSDKKYKELEKSLIDYKEHTENLKNYKVLRDLDKELVETETKIEKLDKLLGLNQEKHKKFLEQIVVIKTELTELEDYQNEFKITLEKNKLIGQELEELTKQHLGLSSTIEHLRGDAAVFEIQNKQLEKEIFNVELEIANNNDKLENLEEILNALSDLTMLTQSEEILHILIDLKKQVKLETLAEIDVFTVYGQILTLLNKIDEHIVEYNKRVASKQQIVSKIGQNVADHAKHKKELILQREHILKKKNDLVIHQTELFTVKTEITSELKMLNNLLEKNGLELNEVTLKIEKSEAASIKLKSVKDRSKQIEVGEAKLQTIEERIFDLNNQILEDSANLKALTIQKNNIKIKMLDAKKLVPNNFKEKLLGSVTAANYEKLEAEVKVYNKKVDYYKQYCDLLKSEIVGQAVNTETYNDKRNNYIYLKEQLNNKIVDYKILEKTIITNRGSLILQNQIETELHEVRQELKKVQELSSLLKGNALMDFVAEEYLHLISNYANKYVLAISRGKYMLKYSSNGNGEFVVVDYFNGGIERGVKSLSGGEKFIFSLSIALGVSQCIGASNNKEVNFFFIDEGFGNLSADYIDDVLYCLNQLIELDFTVGFISHVEKMQEFISNKVIVTKDNNKDGSKINHYY